jgi:tetratricopeptide (TPR) repeat protein
MKDSMKRTILLTITALCMALQVMTAQTKSNDNYKYHKALEILRGDGDPAEARKLLVDNIKENPKHIDSYMLMVAIDRNEEDYASALHVLNDVVKVNYKGSGVPESKILWWRASVYSDMEEYQTAVTIMEEALKKGRKQDKENLSQMLEAMAQFYYENKDYGASDKIYLELLKMDD